MTGEHTDASKICTAKRIILQDHVINEDIHCKPKFLKVLKKPGDNFTMHTIHLNEQHSIVAWTLSRKSTIFKQVMNPETQNNPPNPTTPPTHRNNTNNNVDNHVPNREQSHVASLRTKSSIHPMICID